MERTCFVIQPFDGSKYDKRYKDSFSPAILRAGFKPYRVDHDPSASIPIDEIEKRIKEASACLADITEDNPNVWFELGLAIAFKKEICLVCSKDRKSKYPFDVQHRLIISYATDSPSDFATLESKIEDRLKTFTRLEKNVELAESVVAPLKGLAEHEVACLGFIGSEGDNLGTYRLREIMEKAGFVPLATRLAVKKLSDIGLVKQGSATEYSGEDYECVNLTPTGWQWLESNISNFVLRKKTFHRNLEEEVPF